MHTVATRWADRRAVSAWGASALVACSTDVYAASSASYTISADRFEAAGGASSSASYGLASCVGSEIAGAQSSATFRVDSGCGSVLALALNDPLAVVEPLPVPALTVGSELALSVLVAALACAYRLRIRR